MFRPGVGKGNGTQGLLHMHTHTYKHTHTHTGSPAPLTQPLTGITEVLWVLNDVALEPRAFALAGRQGAATQCHEMQGHGQSILWSQHGGAWGGDTVTWRGHSPGTHSSSCQVAACQATPPHSLHGRNRRARKQDSRQEEGEALWPFSVWLLSNTRPCGPPENSPTAPTPRRAQTSQTHLVFDYNPATN